MASIKETLHIYYLEEKYKKDGGSFILHTAQNLGTPFVYAGSHEVEVPIPEGFDFRAAKLASLREEEKRVRAEFQARITELQRQQSELLAIEMVEAA